MLTYSKASLANISAHIVGNKTNEEQLIPSKAELELTDDLRDQLMHYFLSSFTSSEYFHFTSTDDDFRNNALYQWASDVFESARHFHAKTVSIAKHLYEMSLHPQIKSGDLFVVLFRNVSIGGEETDALGIFKSESKSSILKLAPKKDGHFEIDVETGINFEKLDKACLIFNVEQEKGYRISVIDRSGKSQDAQYWKESFLRIIPENNDFQATKNFLEIARHFVTDQIPEEFEVTKADQLAYLNRSIQYFKEHDEFDKKEFEQEVFEDTELIKSFRKFNTSFRDQFDMEIEDTFEISPEVVKKQARVFKSVLKLDKNFHIYIHGNRDLIERGVEKDGRKYYKIYYTTEL